MKCAIVLLLALAFVSADNDDRLTINVYVESLCPGCQEFMTTSLKKALNTPDIEKIANIRVVPYGNARQSQKSDGSWAFTC
jgi:interferon gamma-inducible protein 30